VRFADHAVEAFDIQRDFEFFVDLAGKLLGTLGQHARVDLGVVALVGGHEPDRVAGRGLNEGRLEHHAFAVRSLVQHLHFEGFRKSGCADQGGECETGCQCADHVLSFQIA